MSSDSTYLVSALEGYGTSTTEKFYEVKPGDSHLRPFTDFLVEKIGNSIPGLWPAKDSLQIITNIENLQGVELTAQNETVRLTGLNGLDLDKDEYVHFESFTKFKKTDTVFHRVGVSVESFYDSPILSV